MDKKQFWEIINRSRKSNKDKADQFVRLFKALSKRTAADINKFYEICFHYLDYAYSWDLWAAAYIINGGCSDDCFADFRFWLISEGEDTYMKALKDPDSLAEHELIMNDDFFSCELAETIRNAYEDKTGEGLFQPPRNIIAKPSGEEWSEDDINALEDRFPKLWEKYC